MCVGGNGLRRQAAGRIARARIRVPSLVVERGDAQTTKPLTNRSTWMTMAVMLLAGRAGRPRRA